jgi:hypothetical protein
VQDFPGSTKCHFEGTAKLAYTPTTAQISLVGTLIGKKVEGPGNCVAGGTISGDLMVSDEFGGEAIVH